MPFTEKGNLMLMNLKLNQFPVEMILDTGAENNLLFQLQLSQALGLDVSREISIIGADQKKFLTAYLIAQAHLALNPTIGAPTSFIALDQEDNPISSILGVDVDGLIGCNLFSNSVLFIDNKKDKISLIPYEDFKIPKGYYYFPIEIIKNRPYLSAKVKIHGQEPKIMKLLIDTGSSVNFLLYSTQNTIKLPEVVIPGALGVGLGGTLEGYVGMVEEIEFGQQIIKDLPCSFQVITDSMTNNNVHHLKEGIIGNAVLSGYNYYIDYYNQILFIKPIRKNKSYKKYDKSGITLIASGSDFNHFLVSYVRPGSPAHRAGVKLHDHIYKIGYRHTETMEIEEVQRYFMRRDGRKTKLVLRRDGRKEKVKFKLKDPFK